MENSGTDQYETNKEWLRAESYQKPENNEWIAFRVFKDANIYVGYYREASNSVEMGVFQEDNLHWNLVKEFKNKRHDPERES